MKSLTINVPSDLAISLESFVKSGIYVSESDVVIAALNQFVKKNQTQLFDHILHEDQLGWSKNEPSIIQ